MFLTEVEERIVGLCLRDGDHDGVEAAGPLRARHHVPEHGAALDLGEGLSGQARGLHAGLNEPEDSWGGAAFMTTHWPLPIGPDEVTLEQAVAHLPAFSGNLRKGLAAQPGVQHLAVHQWLFRSARA